MKVYEGVCAMYIQSVHIQSFFIMYIRMKVSILFFMHITSVAPRELPRSLLCTWDNVNTYESVYAMYIHSVHMQSVYMMYISIKVWIQSYLYITSVVLCELSSIEHRALHFATPYDFALIHMCKHNQKTDTYAHTHTHAHVQTHTKVYIYHTHLYIYHRQI